MTAQTQLKVTSDVRRTLLASAAMFKNEATAVWEYVANSLQYVDPGVSPRVQVTIVPGRRGITISDNGRGMSAQDLQHFFRMHGENLDRIAGRTGRGKFGTDKSAAFGIANSLRVDTVHNGKRNVVMLTRKMIDESQGEEIVPDWEVKDQLVDAPNGTVVSILDINLDRIKQASIVDYIERHLQAFRTSAPAVAIDDHVCSYREPETEETLTFEPTPLQFYTL
jgi:DNA topoisomerase VI subunit B